MQVFKSVQGSKAQALPTVVNVDTVYVHSNIKKLETDFEGNPTDNLYQYDEIQYTKDEYIQLMADRQNLESQFTTELDIDIQEAKLRQRVETEMITQLDIDILDIKQRLEVLENAKARR